MTQPCSSRLGATAVLQPLQREDDAEEDGPLQQEISDGPPQHRPDKDGAVGVVPIWCPDAGIAQVVLQVVFGQLHQPLTCRKDGHRLSNLWFRNTRKRGVLALDAVHLISHDRLE